MNRDISIIIPTLNEQEYIAQTLSRLQNQAGDCEVIVVDGGSGDATVSLARQKGSRIISSGRGRGRQMNLGAEAATGEILLFLHADTKLPDNFQALIRQSAGHPYFGAGAFSLAIDNASRGLAAIARMATLRSRLLHLPYGDQGIFTTRKMFAACGGFPEIAIMEDFVFIRELRRRGRIIILPECAVTSARRWQNMGIVRTTLLNQLIVCGYGCGVPPAMLARWYQRLRGIGIKADK